MCAAYAHRFPWCASPPLPISESKIFKRDASRPLYPVRPAATNTTTKSEHDNDEVLAKILQEEENARELLRKQEEDSQIAKSLQKIEELSSESLHRQEKENEHLQIINQSNGKMLSALQMVKLHTPAGELFPNIHDLFLLFNQTYFENKLGHITVKWSTKMTLCAGLCSWRSRGNLYEAEIKLSEPLLKFRPIEDLIDTFLHEMIHAYLLITLRRLDRDDHGPSFLAQMNKINSMAGTKISVYHSFFDEVAYYQTHHWQCDKCSRVVKRSMNRAPGPRDNDWNSHKQNCGGSYVKIQEPNKPVKQKNSGKPAVTATNNPISNYFKPVNGHRLGASTDHKPGTTAPSGTSATVHKLGGTTAATGDSTGHRLGGPIGHKLGGTATGRAGGFGLTPSGNTFGQSTGHRLGDKRDMPDFTPKSKRPRLA